MGWTYTHRGTQPIKEFLRGETDCTNDKGTKWEMLDCAIVKFRTAYMAVRITRAGQDPYVVAYVFLLDYRPKDDYDTGYKDMDESVGPCEAQCPERILNLLTPTAHEYALEWRRKCWDNIAKGKVFKLKVGMQIETRPIHFSDGKGRSHFLVTQLKPLCLESLGDHVTVRIRRNTLKDCFLKEVT